MRRTATVNIGDEGVRDVGKVFLLTEMPASQAESWAIRAMGAMVRTGMDIPEDVIAGGFASLAVLLSSGIRALLAAPFGDVEPLLIEMMACVQFVPDPANPGVMRRLIETDIEEPLTRLRLREEVFSLHVGFSVAGALSDLASAIRAQADSPNTSTSPGASEP